MRDQLFFIMTYYESNTDYLNYITLIQSKLQQYLNHLSVFCSFGH